MKRPWILLLLSWGLSHAAPAFARRAKAVPAVDIEESLSTATVPQDLEVCFSPEEHCDVKLIKFIQSAKTSLDLAIYDINHEQLVHQLLLQSKRIPVHILIDRRQAKEPKSLVGLLLKGGIEVRAGHQKGIMHNKFVIVDGEMLETGSYNYTHHATLANNENQTYLANPKIVARFNERFRKIWREGRPFTIERTLSSDP